MKKLIPYEIHSKSIFPCPMSGTSATGNQIPKLTRQSRAAIPRNTYRPNGLSGLAITYSAFNSSIVIWSFV